MLVFGVTGGIGCGKTEVCRLLLARNIPILEADTIAKQLTDSSSHSTFCHDKLQSGRRKRQRFIRETSRLDQVYA